MQYRYYKVAINLGPIRHLTHSRVYEIPEGESTVWPGVPFSILTLLLGWWGFNLFKPGRAIRDVTEALHYNFSGGEDLTQVVENKEYDDDTNYVWRNITRDSQAKIDKNTLEAILILQEEFEQDFPDKLYAEENLEAIRVRARELNLPEIREEVLRDIFDTLENWTRTD